MKLFTRFVLSLLSCLSFACCVIAAPRAARACPGCKEALIDPQAAAAQNRAARGYATSITMMLSLPPLLVGGIATIVARSSRRPR